MVYLQKLVNENKSILTKSEIAVGQFIILNGEDSELDLKVVSSNCNVSTTTVIRFCKKLGFQGFKELQIFLAVNSSHSRKNDSIDSEVVSLEMIRKDIYDNVSKTLSNINFDIVEKVVSLIDSTDKVFLYGLSSSRFICEDFARKLNIMGINAESIYEEEMIVLSSKRIKEKDVVIVISLSGNNDLLVNAIELAQSKKADVLSITNNTNNRCASISDLRLYVDIDQVSINENRYRPRYIFMIMMEIIINELLNTRGSK